MYGETLAAPDKAERLGPVLGSLLVLLSLARVLYHCTYLAEVPFALATFSDGRQYELAAIDILTARPWGTQPFYLQGLYAYQLALPMLVRPWISLALLGQLALSGLTSWWFFRVATRWWGRVRGGWATVVFLAYPMLAFYENKFLTAALAVSAAVFVLWAAVRGQEQSRARWAAVLGLAVGVAILARPNFALLVPFAVLGVWRSGPAASRWHRLAALGIGLVLSLAPMAIRNHHVTGRATVVPGHGGGTSFYIGNNRHARGVWNTAGGLFSGDVSREREELREKLGVSEADEAAEMAAIGDALYRRGLQEIVDDPGAWLWLELRKVWLLIGNDELTQDYDLHGEREMLRWAPRVGLPLGVLLAFAGFGVLGLRRELATRPGRWALPLWMVAGLVCSIVAANLLYFTSAQHRLPLIVVAALLVPWGVAWLREAAAQRRWVPLAIFAAWVAISFVPRTHKDSPSAVHYYNLSVAWVHVGQPSRGVEALGRALQLRPEHPVIRIERATLLRQRGAFERARADLDALDRLPDVPRWVRDRATDERRRLEAWGL